MSRVKRTENCFSHDIKQLDSNWKRKDEITSVEQAMKEEQAFEDI